MIKVAIHQRNFCPWFPYFYKMAMADIFVFLDNVQFEKNGYQNRFRYKDKWITKPVNSGVDIIRNKDYVGHEPEMAGDMLIEHSLVDINGLWIRTIRKTLNIKTELTSDYMCNKVYETPTHRLIDIIKSVKGDVYITNPDAKNKYLDEGLMTANGIAIEYCKVPKNLNIHVFEAFEKWGIEGTIKQLPKRKLCESLY